MTNIDLFDGLQKRIILSNAKGYAGMPGRGVEGKSCKDCKHFVRIQLSKTYFKCGITNYTSGKATDIKANAPSCQFYEDEPK